MYKKRIKTEYDLASNKKELTIQVAPSPTIPHLRYFRMILNKN